MLKQTSSLLLRTSCLLLGAVALASLSACGDDGLSEPTPAPGFLGGVAGNREIGVVINAGAHAITMFQLGAPATTVQIPLGSSATITPTGLSLRGRKAAVPLGNAASVALINLETQTITRFFTFPSGNATGSVWTNDTTVFVANTATNKVGRFYIGQTDGAITATADVALQPTAVEYAGGRVFVISGNFTGFPPTTNGAITVINPLTMGVIGTISSGGLNPQDAAVGTDGMLYVLNTGDYTGQGSISIINPTTLAITTIPNLGVGPGSISIDNDGLAYLSSFSDATTVWSTRTRAIVRGTGNPLCAKRASTGLCRGASDAVASASGKVYQTFFGSASQGLSPYVFVYSPITFALTDSIAVGPNPISVSIRTF